MLVFCLGVGCRFTADCLHQRVDRFAQFFRRPVVEQDIVAVIDEKCVVLLGIDPCCRFRFCPTVALHDPVQPFFPAAENADDGVTELCHAAFDQGNRLDGRVGFPTGMHTVGNGLYDDGMCQFIQVFERLRV